MGTTRGNGRCRRPLLAGALLGLALGLAGCNTVADQIVTGGVPEDVRARHPIAIEEGTHAIVVFVGPPKKPGNPETAVVKEPAAKRAKSAKPALATAEKSE